MTPLQGSPAHTGLCDQLQNMPGRWCREAGDSAQGVPRVQAAQGESCCTGRAGEWRDKKPQPRGEELLAQLLAYSPQQRPAGDMGKTIMLGLSSPQCLAGNRLWTAGVADFQPQLCMTSSNLLSSLFLSVPICTMGGG